MMDSPGVYRVLVVEDEGLMRWTMRERLSQAGLDVLEAETAALETSDPEIARIYRRDVTRIRAQWRRN